MNRLIGIPVALAVCLLVIVGASCQSSIFQKPRTVSTTHKDRDWHANFLQQRISFIQPAKTGVQITGHVFGSPDAETHTVPIGHKFTFPDDHGSNVYTIRSFQDDGMVIEYESTFYHQSFGKNIIEKDKGTFLLPWLPPMAAAAHSLSREEHVHVVVLERMLKTWAEIAASGNESPQITYLAVSSTPHLFGDKSQPRDPSDKVTHALGEWQARKFSECVVRTSERMAVTDRQTGAPGRILWVGPIKWIDDNTGETSAGVWENPKFSPGEMLRVHWKDDKWTVTATGGWLTWSGAR